MNEKLYLEDLHVGQRFTSGTQRMDEDRIKEFAAEFDPQPFHLDQAAAHASVFRGLAASGWHTAAVTMRLMVTGGIPDATAPGSTFRSLSGGILVQERDRLSAGPDGLRTVTRRGPSETEIGDLLFADKVAKHVKSNAIVFARGGATVGIGAGQMSRVDSVKIAATKAAEAGKAAGLPRSPSVGSVLASDAFFPFADGVAAAIGAGVTAIIQPGGSVRDEEIIAAADAAGIAMVFTGLRHFRH